MKKLILISVLLILGVSLKQPEAVAASYTITIPDNIVNDVIDAIAYQHGYKDVIPDLDNPAGFIANPESKLTFAKRMNRRWIRLNVKAWETNKAQNDARDQAIIDADNKTNAIDVR